MTAVARATDPETSHEAAATVDLIRSQMLVLTFAREYLGEIFTDKSLVTAYQRTHAAAGYPPLSDSRLRTARGELAGAGLIFHAGHTRPSRGRRERIWTLDPDLATKEN